MKKLLLILTLVSVSAFAGPNVKLVWDASTATPTVTNYVVYYSLAPITATNGLPKVSVTNSLTTTISNLSYSTTYYFRATAKQGTNESDFSNEASYTTPVLPAPSNLSITPAP